MNWLLLSNCQASGLGNCLNLLSSSITVKSMGPAKLAEDRSLLKSQCEQFDRVLIAPQVASRFQADLEAMGNAWLVPTIRFNAYHPDTCYLRDLGETTKGLLGEYHSIIAFAAHSIGLDADCTTRLYCAEVFERLGYFNVWDHAKATLLEDFAGFGWDVSGAFLEWVAAAPFMHSVNHPAIACLRDLALLILERAGIEPDGGRLLPPDNLLNGPVFPIYPEIGERLGISGSYRFKPSNTFKTFGLNEFVADSMKRFRAGKPDVEPHLAPRIAHAIDIIREFAR